MFTLIYIFIGLNEIFFLRSRGNKSKCLDFEVVLINKNFKKIIFGEYCHIKYKKSKKG